MNGQHWTDYTEAQLAAIKNGGTIHASRRSRGTPLARVGAPDVTAETRAALAGRVEPAYPAEWLPEIQARAQRAAVKATTPAEWLRDNAPDPHEHRNGTAPAGSPAAEAYPAEWLSQADLSPPRGLGGEGWINRRAA